MKEAPNNSSRHDENCIFCRILQAKAPAFRLRESNMSLAFMDSKPSAKGHFLVIPKRHVEVYHEMKIEELNDVHQTAQKLIKSFGMESYTLVSNNQFLQEVPHFHLHVIPGPRNRYFSISKEELSATHQEMLDLIEEPYAPKRSEMTCFACPCNTTCSKAWDPANIDGVCLASE